MIRIALAVVAMLALCGFLNGADVRRCVESGHSEAVCFSVINP